MTRGLMMLLPAFLVLASALAQEDKKFEPQFSSVFYYLNGAGNAVDLERRIPDAVRKGDKVLWTMAGEKSPVRLDASERMRFVVRVAEDFEKAKGTVQLVRFETKQGQRQLLMKLGDLTQNRGTIKLNALKYGDSSIELIPTEPLTAGEYCLTRSTIAQGFCFGVD